MEILGGFKDCIEARSIFIMGSEVFKWLLSRLKMAMLVPRSLTK